MEQARHWIWTKQNHGLNSHRQASSKPSYGDSWEEQAFAEDAAGQLGGCVWPPRSYSCSFCGREFRSAQALGGHMNVHRRDRARLKQSPISHSELVLQNDHQNHHLPNAYTSFGFQYPSQLYPLVGSPNPNSDPGVIQSPSSSSRVSTTPTQENCCEKAFFPLSSSSSSIVEEERKRSPRSCPLSRDSRPNMTEDRHNHISDPRNIEGEKKSRILESDCRAKVDYVKTDLAVSLNLVVRRTRPTISDCDEEGSMGCKRRRTESGNLKSPLSFSPKSNSVDRHHVQSEVFEISPCSIDELDLELRLGDPPKVR